MGRHVGAVEKLERREGVDLGLKGTRDLAGVRPVAEQLVIERHSHR